MRLQVKPSLCIFLRKKIILVVKVITRHFLFKKISSIQKFLNIDNIYLRIFIPLKKER